MVSREQIFRQGTFVEKIAQFSSMLADISMQNADATAEQKRERLSKTLNLDDFITSVKALFGYNIHNEDLKAVHRKLITNPNAKIDWTELFGYLQNEDNEMELPSATEEQQIFAINKQIYVGEAAGDIHKRESMQLLRKINSLDLLFGISQRGIITVWNSRLKLQVCVDLKEPAWSTSVEYLPGIRKVLCSTERGLHFFDLRATETARHIYSIKPFPNAPLCLTTVPYGYGVKEDSIIFGDDGGYVNFVTISNKDLMPRQIKGDKQMKQSFNIDTNSLINPLKRRKFHEDGWINQIKYFPSLKCFGNCSSSSVTSFYLTPLDSIWNTNELRHLSVNKGVNAFDYCVKANVIITGGVDKVVRVWHPHLWTRPTGRLVGHLFTVCDIVCNQNDQQVISLSTARVLRVWDVVNFTCLQIFSNSDDHLGEKRIFSLIFDHDYDRLLIGSGIIEAIPLTRTVQDTMQIPVTHDRQIVELIYNPHMSQFVSVCSKSTVKVWDAETGHLTRLVNDPHGEGIELTAMALDFSGFRLATGGYDGSLKVWDMASGQEMKGLQGIDSEDDNSIINISFCTSDRQRCIFVYGWSKMLKLFSDSDDYHHELTLLKKISDTFIPEIISTSTFDSKSNQIGDELTSSLNPYPKLPYISQTQFSTANDNTSVDLKLLQFHDITCHTQLTNASKGENASVIITGCENGNLILWSTATSQAVQLFLLDNSMDLSNFSKSMKDSQPSTSRVNCIAILTHRVKIVIKRKRTSIISNEFDNKLNEITEENKENDEINAEIVQEPLLQTNDHNIEQIANIPLETDRLSQSNFAKYSNLNEEYNDDSKNYKEYHPVIATCHEDGLIRFWDINHGQVLLSATPKNRYDDQSLTAIASDTNANLLVVADKRGYMTTFNISEYFETTAEYRTITQNVYWRAHMSRINRVCYISAHNVFASSGMDGSVRFWYAVDGSYLGYLGQVRIFTFPNASEESKHSNKRNNNLPFDVTEKPVIEQHKTVSAQQKERAVRNMEYPLIFMESRWDPFSRTKFMRDAAEKETAASVAKQAVTFKGQYKRDQLTSVGRTILEKPFDRKFFKAMVKPRAYSDHLEKYTSGEVKSGAIFRALPVYRVRTPTNVRPPSGLEFYELAHKQADATDSKKTFGYYREHGTEI